MLRRKVIPNRSPCSSVKSAICSYRDWMPEGRRLYSTQAWQVIRVLTPLHLSPWVATAVLRSLAKHKGSGVKVLWRLGRGSPYC